MHIGIDTVMLRGKGFLCLLSEGSKVMQGQRALELDLNYLNSNVYYLIISVVSNMGEFGILTVTTSETVVAGQSPLLDITGR
ncbi:MAG: N-acetylglucosamine specific PTS enzyme IIABC component [Sodalis sp. Fle]|nr:MAG: N-acetylglucosamine specific PTS enzyme IIABC component [Sodalis sp. Fle]